MDADEGAAPLDAGGPRVILLAVALAAVIPLYRIGMLPLPGEMRSANFKRLWRALDYAYPYFAEKGVDWDAVYARYAPQAQQAHSDEAYWRVVARMLAELNDGHTGVVWPSAQSGRRYFATGYLIGEARFSTAAFRRNDGSLIEGIGIAPHSIVF